MHGIDLQCLPTSRREQWESGVVSGCGTVWRHGCRHRASTDGFTACPAPGCGAVHTPTHTCNVCQSCANASAHGGRLHAYQRGTRRKYVRVGSYAASMPRKVPRRYARKRHRFRSMSKGKTGSDVHAVCWNKACQQKLRARPDAASSEQNPAVIAMAFADWQHRTICTTDVTARRCKLCQNRDSAPRSSDCHHSKAPLPRHGAPHQRTGMAFALFSLDVSDVCDATGCNSACAADVSTDWLFNRRGRRICINLPVAAFAAVRCSCLR
ncbi:hypothetical protein CFBP2533_07920 [Xanthomonas hortorum pv. pelargonii]|uniref:Uncharacterized protein n=1 Tax=Xanthomonas hortorum pv. pelargonii TaxID=453602 RepID=A0A6V7C0J1_9XANT|nr:hypothetical protein CFBP2533_07920 [Xanthomonas hortorum pv. pelargonii]CAD0307377.1 hypothetical protein CFBP2533_07920 [Xanthomonas hortorum pv. pelargonii]